MNRVLSRRSFLRRAMAAAGAAGVPVFVPVLGRGQTAPSNRITMALIGMGLMMQGHLRGMCGRGDVQVVAVCDVDRGRREKARAEVESIYGKDRRSGAWRGCEAYNEHERIMERTDIDAVPIATPDTGMRRSPAQPSGPGRTSTSRSR